MSEKYFWGPPLHKALGWAKQEMHPRGSHIPIAREQTQTRTGAAWSTGSALPVASPLFSTPRSHAVLHLGPAAWNVGENHRNTGNVNTWSVCRLDYLSALRFILWGVLLNSFVFLRKAWDNNFRDGFLSSFFFSYPYISATLKHKLYNTSFGETRG